MGILWEKISAAIYSELVMQRRYYGNMEIFSGYMFFCYIFWEYSSTTENFYRPFLSLVNLDEILLPQCDVTG